MNHPHQEPLYELNGIEIGQEYPLSQKRFVELILRDATIELILADDDRITGKIHWRNDARCFVLAADDGNWIGIPPEDHDDVETVLDLYANRTVEKMHFRLIEPLGPRIYAPGEGLDENLNSTVTADQIQEDIRYHRGLAARMMAITDDNARRSRNARPKY